MDKIKSCINCPLRADEKKDCGCVKAEHIFHGVRYGKWPDKRCKLQPQYVEGGENHG